MNEINQLYLYTFIFIQQRSHLDAISKGEFDNVDKKLKSTCYATEVRCI